MTSQTDRIAGISGSLAIKAPVVAATTANITLSGEQTINSVAVVADDRVLVKDQTDATENGIYDVSSTAWSRSKDFNGARDAVTGTLVFANNVAALYRLTTTGTIEIGTDSLTFVPASNINPDVISITDFGANVVSSDNSAAIQAALDATPGVLIVPAGVFRVTSSLEIKGDIIIEGPGVIDGQLITSLGVSEGVLNATGTITQLGTLNASVTEGDDNFTISATPSDVVQGDWLVLWDPATFSYSADRINYHAGEFVTVQSIAGAVVQIPAGVFADYGTSVEVHKVTPISVKIRDLTILSGENNLGSSESFKALALTLCHEIDLTSCKFRGGYSTCVSFSRCYNFKVDNCVIQHFETTSQALDYGISLNNCQQGSVTNCPDITGHRHGVTFGAIGGTAGAIVNRQILIEGNKVKTTGGPNPFAVDYHGNTEHCNVRGNHLHGGLQMAGTENAATDNDIVAYKAAACIQLREMAAGCANSIADNRCRVNGRTAVEGGFVRWASGALTFDVNTGPGTLSITDNKITVDGAIPGVILFIQSDGLSTAEINLVMTGNEYDLPANTETVAINISSAIAGTYPFNKITLDDIVLNGSVGIQHFSDLEIDGKYYDPITGVPTDYILDVTDWENSVTYSKLTTTGGRLAARFKSGQGDTPVAGSRVIGSNGKFLDWAEGNPGIGVEVSAIDVYLMNNTFVPGTDATTALHATNVTNLRNMWHVDGDMGRTGVPTIDLSMGIVNGLFKMEGLPTSSPGGTDNLHDNAGSVDKT